MRTQGHNAYSALPIHAAACTHLDMSMPPPTWAPTWAPAWLSADPRSLTTHVRRRLEHGYPSAAARSGWKGRARVSSPYRYPLPLQRRCLSHERAPVLGLSILLSQESTGPSTALVSQSLLLELTRRSFGLWLAPHLAPSVLGWSPIYVSCNADRRPPPPQRSAHSPLLPTYIAHDHHHHHHHSTGVAHDHSAATDQNTTAPCGPNPVLSVYHQLSTYRATAYNLHPASIGPVYVSFCC
ncbi:hypothetical protein P280DRAFT_287228 [Massarina eburnea CBS 473.64]|uniref:Uncharacterized protein n=1 Tax=Massarina eburnea CBS 473.64 TaxID=1395130 RepID=A0A6A6S432_9PLEO|nr:hypothetical protein P280DRAFT_287228 [Massarina eburnea CBS 473.64]